MESPPPLPAPEPLGRAFWILLVAPVASMALAAGIAAIGGDNAAGGFGVILSLATLLAMLVCSILCAITVGKRKGLGLGVLTFLGIQIVYIGVAFAGCASMMNGMNFH